MNAQTAVEVLIAARELVSTPDRWTQDVSARDHNGAECDPDSPAAACFCSLTALYKAGGRNERTEVARGIFMRAVRQAVSQYNDAPRRTHAQILAAFDRAIARARERGL